MNNLSNLNVPGPTKTVLTEPFWNAAEEGRLIVQRCENCGEAILYPRAICPHCWNENLSWEQASGKAILKSFSEVWKPGHPGWTPVAPYFVGLVTLAEGPTILSHILSKDSRPVVGDCLTFCPTDIGGRILPCFKKTT